MTEFKFRDKKFIIFGDIFLYDEKCYHFIAKEDWRFVNFSDFCIRYRCTDKEIEIINEQYLSNQIHFPDEKYNFKTDYFESLADDTYCFIACLVGTENSDFLLNMMCWIKNNSTFLNTEFIIELLTSRHHIPDIVLDEIIFDNYHIDIKKRLASREFLKERHFIHLSKIPDISATFILAHYQNNNSIELLENFAKYQPVKVIHSLLFSYDIPQYLEEYLVLTKHSELRKYNDNLFGFPTLRNEFTKDILFKPLNQLLMKN